MAERVLWVTGGGTGMGRATAMAAVAAGWSVALSGRRSDVLDDATAAVRGAGGRAMAVPVDVADTAAVRSGLERIRQELGPVTDLVLAAGTNSRQRRWSDQSIAEFQTILAANVTGVATVVDAALPDLRAAAGTVVVVSSFSAWSFSPVAGVAYSASKTALGALCRTLNSEEESSGVRATHLCPGDVATDLLDQRPEVPDVAARARMLQPEDIARAALFILSSPAHVRVDELVISPIRP